MKRLGTGQVILLTTLVVILIFTAIWATSVWTATGDAVMSNHGGLPLAWGLSFPL
jgi:hypothetical protein